MSFFSFNKRIKHRSFDYTPRYYDPEKEAMAERMEQYQDGGNEVEKTKRRIRSGLKQKYRADLTVKKKARRDSNVRLLMIIIVLITITIFFLQSSSILNFVETFTNG